MGYVQEGEQGIKTDTLSNQDRIEWAFRMLGEFRDNKFDPIFSAMLEEEVALTRRIAPEGAKFAERSIELGTRGGKRLRPSLVYYGYKSVGGNDERAVLHAAAAFETLHTGMVAIDDVFDGAMKRRKKPALNAIFAKEYQDTKTGESMAVLAGLRLINTADQMLDTAPFPRERLDFALRLYRQMYREAVIGEELELDGDMTGDVGLDKAEKIADLKSGRYTIQRPLMAGAALGGAGIDVIAAFSYYGVRVGKAFQIRDDILGMYGDEETTGKSATSDLKEGKRTILIVKALEELRKNERTEDEHKLLNILGNPDLTEDNYRWVQGVIEKTGSLKYAKNLAGALVDESKYALDMVDIDIEAKDYLLGIADYVGLIRDY